MISISSSLARAFGQLGDPAVLRVLAKSVLVTLAVFAISGAALFAGLYNWLVSLGVSYSAEIGSLVAVLVTVLGGWLLFRIVALFVLQFFADEVVEAVERRHYPADLAAVRKIPASEELSNAARGALRALIANLIALPFAIALLVTGIGTALLFWAVNSWLLGRELQDMVWLRHRHDPAQSPPVGAIERFLLGGAITAMMVVPFLNLLAPVIGAASATHLVHGKRRTQA